MTHLLNLEELGARLKEVDEMIISMIASRMDLAKQVGEFKRANGQDIVRLDIEEKRIGAMKVFAKAHGLSEHLAGLVFYSLINESCKSQLEQLEKDSRDKNNRKSNGDLYEELKNNLLRLTEKISESYDENYSSGFFATKEYLVFEKSMIDSTINTLETREVMIDLGCATGKISLDLSHRFEQTIGYDISQHMVYAANQKAEVLGVQDKAIFCQRDLEDGIPAENGSVSFAVMSLGTASDMRNIEGVLSETLRVLKPGGKFLFSFYNADALLYRWGFLPWRHDLAASININRHCLEVRLAGEEFSVYARPYSVAEVRELFLKFGIEIAVVTFPTIGAILPHALFENQPETRSTITLVDQSLVDLEMGAYIVVTGQKNKK